MNCSSTQSDEYCECQIRNDTNQEILIVGYNSDTISTEEIVQRNDVGFIVALGVIDVELDMTFYNVESIL